MFAFEREYQYRETIKKILDSGIFTEQREIDALEYAITIIKKYAEIVHKVEEFNRKTTPRKHIETNLELQMSLKELEAHTMCLANQVRDIVGEIG